MVEVRKHICNVRRPKVFQLAYNEEERERWNEDARFLGFTHCGAAYIRFILNARADGHLILNDAAFGRLARTFGEVFGTYAGEIIARVERMFLEGAK